LVVLVRRVVGIAEVDEDTDFEAADLQLPGEVEGSPLVLDGFLLFSEMSVHFTKIGQ
jgi:hypothetical protein